MVHQNDKFLTGIEYLKKNDPIMNALISKIGLIDFEPNSNLFECLSKIIISQQLSNSASRTIFRRIKKLTDKFEPKIFISLNKTEILGCGVSRSKYTYLEGIANLIIQNELNLDKLSRLSDENINEVLLSIRGIGKWSSAVFMIFGLAKLDVFPESDVALKNSVIKYYHLNAYHQHQDSNLEKIINSWGVFKSIACLYLWKAYDENIIINLE